MATLTKRQKQVYDFIYSFSKKHGVSPTVREIAGYFRLSPPTIQEHKNNLVKKGLLNRDSGSPRGIELSNQNEQMVQIPLLGTIAAGQPLTLFDTVSENIAVPKNKLPNSSSNDIYALKVAGDSMVEENIHDGDTILVRHQNTAENGQKIVALVDGGATLKKFYKERGQVRLQPANKKMEPIIVRRGQDFHIQGIMLDVIETSEIEQPNQPFVLPSKKSPQQRGNISDYINKVYNGDVMHVLKDLPDNSIDMVFGDPDYNVGIKYGENNYTKKFEDYINWYVELTRESMRVLKNDGNLFMMNYPQQNAHLRVKYLDLHFPNIHEYVWVYNTNVGHTPKRFTTAHRSILHVRKGVDNKFFKDAVALPYKNPMDRRIRQNLANGSKGRMPYSWFEFNLVKNVSKEKTYHACQIPQKLTEMLIKSSTKPKDIVFALFGGSGAEIDVCKNLNRQFISAEIDKKYCDIINDRLTNGYIDQKYKLLRGRKRNLDV